MPNVVMLNRWPSGRYLGHRAAALKVALTGTLSSTRMCPTHCLWPYFQMYSLLGILLLFTRGQTFGAVWSWIFSLGSWSFGNSFIGCVFSLEYCWGWQLGSWAHQVNTLQLNFILKNKTNIEKRRSELSAHLDVELQVSCLLWVQGPKLGSSGEFQVLLAAEPPACYLRILWGWFIYHRVRNVQRQNYFMEHQSTWL